MGDNIPVTIKLTDGEGQALAATEIKLQGTTAITGMTDGAGIFHTTVSSTKDAQVKFIASALGSADTLILGFWTTPPNARTRSLLLFADPARIAATQNEKSNIKAILYDDDHNPVANKVITFTANHGLITSVDTTNNEGVATAVYSGIAQDVDAVITASYAGTNSIRQASTTITSTGLQFEVKAGRTEALLNDSVPVSIRVRDAAGNPIPDAKITYNGSPGEGAMDSGSVDFWKVLPSKNDNSVGTIRNMRIFSSRSQLHADNSDLATIFVILTNENNNPARGENIKFTSDFGIIDQIATVDSAGRATVTLHSSPVNGVCHIVATAVGRNLTATTDVLFNGVTLQLASSRTDLKVGEAASLEAFLKDASGSAIGGDQIVFTLTGPGTFDNGAGAPVAGATISFAINAGKISSSSATTDGAGKASIYIRSASFAGTATVQANASGGTAHISVGFNSSSAKSIKLTITADNIAINGGIANLRAVVADADGNMVSGQAVNFRILKGPGGGENITKPVVNTQAGIAVSQLQSGSLSSSYRGTLVVASTGNLSETSKLTISGTAHIVTVSRPQDDSVQTSGVGTIDESTFEFFVGAVVQDIIGNAVADGTEVHFSAVVTGLAVGHRILVHWDRLGNGSNTSVKPIYKTVLMDVPFEDINTALSFINNDFAVAINVSATTKNGVANARLRYPRQFAQRLIVNVNAEANGVRDADGERFPLPLIK